MKIQNVNIQHAENGGEFLIPTTKYKADGYCKETNTIYEMNGAFYHSDPRMFPNRDEIHPLKKTMTHR